MDPLELDPNRGFQKSLISLEIKYTVVCVLHGRGVKQYRIMINGIDFGVKLTEFEAWLCQFTTVDTSYSTSLRLCFLIC